MWAGGLEREKGTVGGAGGPYEGLEGRVGFWDVRVSERGVFFLSEDKGRGRGEWEGGKDGEGGFWVWEMRANAFGI